MPRHLLHAGSAGGDGLRSSEQSKAGVSAAGGTDVARLIQKAKDGGHDVIQTYFYWNNHEGQYYFAD